MAFVCKSERVLKFQPNYIQSKTTDEMSNPQVGPGAYLGQGQLKVKVSNAPFASKSPREVGAVITQRNPGPGEYKYHVGFEQVNNQSAMQGILAKLQNGSKPFISNQKRFDMNQTQNVLGPGQYLSNQESWGKHNKSMNQIRSKSHLKDTSQQEYKGLLNKHHSPPSIPSGDFRYGYKMETDGHHMISLKTQLGPPLPKPHTLLGPGSYEQNIDPLVKKRGGVVSYAQDTSKRSQIQTYQNSKVVGPGSYDLLKPVQVPLYKHDPNHQSSMFASQTKRQTSIDPRKKEKMHLKLRRFTQATLSRNDMLEGSKTSLTNLDSRKNITAMSQYIEDSDIEEEEGGAMQSIQEEDRVKAKITPGPGSYINQDAQTSFRKIYKPPQYQFFGSTEDRFQGERNMDSILKSKLGPGCYNTQVQLNKLTFKTVGFQSEIDRFYVRDKKIPGPGFYQNADNALHVLKEPHSHSRVQNCFGSQEKRFVLKDNQIPGPGEYKPERSIKVMDNKKHEITLMSSPFLGSKANRQISHPVLDQSPAVGTYDPNISTLNKSPSKLDSPSKSVHILRSKSKEPAPFASDVKRFESEKRYTQVGPGYYETQQESKKPNYDYFTAASRFEYGSYLDKSKAKVPGPGQYRGQDEEGINAKNKSFNLMFN